MEISKLKKFAQFARRTLIKQVEAKLKLVLDEGSTSRRENSKAVEKLGEQIKASSKEQMIEKIAYLWFNRFCALRFMDVNRYTRIGILSPAEGQFQPEILAEAKMGHIDEELIPENARQQIFALLGGTSPSPDPQTEAYRLLVVATCNYYYKAMPYLFERIADYTELLMPDDLLSGNSILAYTREAMTPDVCRDVEVIGWLYQFYISEKKDEVFNSLKKNKKITPENIPAATQLFTPHWIVRYLVENSLGRLWMLNHPKSRLIEKMDYYIQPTQPEIDFLCITKPEELKICDPACGSGHMLVYAFDLLYAIYEEEGYEPAGIPEKILTHNLYGIEIDERAGELAAFALTIKARSKYRQFFNKPIQPHICVLENIQFEKGELKNYMDFIGQDRFTASLQVTLQQFEEAENFGSLIYPADTGGDNVLRILESKNVSGYLFLSLVHQKVLKALKQANYLKPKYHIVIANPPYMGYRNMNSSLKAFAKKIYPSSSADLFAMFIERSLSLLLHKGIMAFITMQSWMFLSSYEKLRSLIVSNYTILSMAHIGPKGFDSIGGEVVSTTAFIVSDIIDDLYNARYIRLVEGESEQQKANLLINASDGCRCGNRVPYIYQSSTHDFKSIPKTPLSYWANKKLIKAFSLEQTLNDICPPRIGMMTTDNERFLKIWSEISFFKIGFNFRSSKDAENSNIKWFPYNKGGSYRKWAGNRELIVNWKGGGQEIKDAGMTSFRGKDFYFKEGITWSDVATGDFSCRYTPEGFIFDIKGTSCFPETAILPIILKLLNSRVGSYILKFLNPTMSYQSGDIRRIPVFTTILNNDIVSNETSTVKLAQTDWDSYETSWDFDRHPLLHPAYRQPSLKGTYAKLSDRGRKMTMEMQRLEEENNRIFIEAYGLEDELTPEVPLSEITLTCNPHYRYNGDKSEKKLEALLLADTMKEFISYAVGCMFGRYSLDKPGLILANQGEDIFDFRRKILYLEDEPDLDDQSKIKNLQSKITFMPDIDNVIPILESDWFPDDISERFRKFLRVTFGEEHYEENLTFIEKALGKDIRKYFLKDFYNDHIKRYKKRPIYWLFSSPKGSFNALIYMHRYSPDTVSVVLNDYLREFRTKLISRVDHQKRVEAGVDVSQAEKIKALKEIEKLNKRSALSPGH